MILDIEIIVPLRMLIERNIKKVNTVLNLFMHWKKLYGFQISWKVIDVKCYFICFNLKIKYWYFIFIRKIEKYKHSILNNLEMNTNILNGIVWGCYCVSSYERECVDIEICCFVIFSNRFQFENIKNWMKLHLFTFIDIYLLWQC